MFQKNGIIDLVVGLTCQNVGEMINVIYLVSRLKQSGPINQAFNIVTGMDKSKCNMIVVTLSPELPKTRMQMYKDAGIEVIQLNRKDWDIIGCVRDLKKLILARNIDIVHSSGDRPDICNHFLRKKVTTVTTLRSEIINIAERKGRVLKWLTRTIHTYNIKTVQMPIACSHFLAKSIEQSTKRKISVIHNCVNTEFYKPSKDKKSSKDELGLDANKTVFLSLGSIIKRKNNDILLDYFTKNQNSDEVLIMAGDGEMLDYYKAKYTSSNIIFVGRVNALPYLQASDYLVSASLSEGLPNTVLESISCGVPVILSDIGPHREIVGEGEVGVLFNSGRMESLEAAVKKIESFDYNTLTTNCRRLANKTFSINATASKYLDLYSSLLNIN